MAYALTGLFAAAGGLAVTASTGIGSPQPGPYTLESVAAIVLGGVSLAGGRGGLVGPIVAVFVLALVRADLTFMGIDPNVTTVIRGAILVGVVMFGGLVAIRRTRA
jgi:ribose transport system permease protein